MPILQYLFSSVNFVALLLSCKLCHYLSNVLLLLCRCHIKGHSQRIFQPLGWGCKVPKIKEYAQWCKLIMLLLLTYFRDYQRLILCIYWTYFYWNLVREGKKRSKRHAVTYFSICSLFHSLFLSLTHTYKHMSNIHTCMHVCIFSCLHDHMELCSVPVSIVALSLFIQDQVHLIQNSWTFALHLSSPFSLCELE